MDSDWPPNLREQASFRRGRPDDLVRLAAHLGHCISAGRVAVRRRLTSALTDSCPGSDRPRLTWRFSSSSGIHQSQTLGRGCTMRRKMAQENYWLPDNRPYPKSKVRILRTAIAERGNAIGKLARSKRGTEPVAAANRKTIPRWLSECGTLAVLARASVLGQVPTCAFAFEHSLR